MPKEIKILSLSFLLIFLGFNGVQSYVTTFFADAKMAEVGFRSLVMIYLAFIAFEPLSAIFVSKFGGKKCMIGASFFYFTFLLALLTKSQAVVYLASVLAGAAASFLWTGQNTYLIRASEGKAYGANSGFFNSFQAIGSAVGVLIFGILISKFLYKIPFLIFSVFPLLGFFLLFSLRDLGKSNQVNHFKLIKKAITSVTALRLSVVGFAFSFIYGLIIGIIPIEIQSVLGKSYIGILTSVFYILPISFSFILGKVSDVKGRKTMIIFSYFLLLAGLVFLLLSKNPIFLVLGILILALNYTIMRPMSYAFTGDVSTKDNLEFLTALFWMVQNIGLAGALLLSQALRGETRNIYIFSIFVVSISLLILLPIFKLSIEKIREKIAQEVS